MLRVRDGGEMYTPTFDTAFRDLMIPRTLVRNYLTTQTIKRPTITTPYHAHTPHSLTPSILPDKEYAHAYCHTTDTHTNRCPVHAIDTPEAYACTTKDWPAPPHPLLSGNSLSYASIAATHRHSRLYCFCLPFMYTGTRS